MSIPNISTSVFVKPVFLQQYSNLFASSTVILIRVFIDLGLFDLGLPVRGLNIITSLSGYTIIIILVTQKVKCFMSFVTQM